MRKLTISLFIITIITLNACHRAVKTKENQKTTSFDTIARHENNLLEAKIESLLNHDMELINVLTRAVKVYPDDSASLIDFYSRIYSKYPKENQKHIKRIEGLISKSNVDQYRLVHKNLKPLMVSIISYDTVSISQVREFVKYYSFYDNFSGESLFHGLLNDDDNYKLVWESLKKIVHTPLKDTTYISLIIELNNNIRTNAELAEAMEGFIIESIKNNPKGLLDMFIVRNKEARKIFTDYISYYDEPDKDLINIYKEISISTDIHYQNAAKELLDNVKNYR